MVVFSCDGCAEVLKKNQVDAHASRCRRCVSVSCADCLVSFPEDDYRAHTSCMTEVERYEKRGPGKKCIKVTPQQHWMDLLSSCVESCPAHLKHYLQTMVSLDNVPRKEKPFRNFAENSLNLASARDRSQTVNEIWKYLMVLKDQQRQQQPVRHAREVMVGDGEKQKEKSMQAAESTKLAPTSTGPLAVDQDTPQAEIKTDLQADKVTAKRINKVMKRVLKGSKDNSMPFKKLRQAVRTELGLSRDEKKTLKRLMHQNLSKKTFTLEDKVVRLQLD